MSLPRLLAFATVAAVSGYILSRMLAEQRTVAPDDREAELIARYRPAIERALGSENSTGG